MADGHDPPEVLTVAHWQAIARVLLDERDRARAAEERARTAALSAVSEAMAAKADREQRTAESDGAARTIEVLRSEVVQAMVQMRLAADLLGRGRNREHSRGLLLRVKRLAAALRGNE